MLQRTKHLYVVIMFMICTDLFGAASNPFAIDENTIARAYAAVVHTAEMQSRITALRNCPDCLLVPISARVMLNKPKKQVLVSHNQDSLQYKAIESLALSFIANKYTREDTLAVVSNANLLPMLVEAVYFAINEDVNWKTEVVREATRTYSSRWQHNMRLFPEILLNHFKGFALQDYIRRDKIPKVRRMRDGSLLKVSGAYLANIDGIEKQLGADSLIDLDVHDNMLTRLPDSISRLSLLTRLNLSKNQFIVFPEAVISYEYLRHLNLSHNQLTTLPKIFSELTRLRYLNLSHNKLTVVSNCIGKLPRLKALDLSNNELSTFLDHADELPLCLETLNLNNNRFTVFPRRIAELEFLRCLELKSNQLTTLPTCSVYLLHLSDLNLSQNQLVLIPEGALNNFYNLGRLDLSHNRLISIPESLKKLYDLRELVLNDNYFTEKERYHIQQIMAECHTKITW